MYNMMFVTLTINFISVPAAFKLLQFLNVVKHNPSNVEIINCIESVFCNDDFCNLTQNFNFFTQVNDTYIPSSIKKDTKPQVC